MDAASGRGEDLADGRDCAMLELAGSSFEASVSFAPSGGSEMRALVRIHKRFARSLGLIAKDCKSLVHTFVARH